MKKTIIMFDLHVEKLMPQIHHDIVKMEIQRGLAVLLTSNPRVRRRRMPGRWSMLESNGSSFGRRGAQKGPGSLSRQVHYGYPRKFGTLTVRSLTNSTLAIFIPTDVMGRLSALPTLLKVNMMRFIRSNAIRCRWGISERLYILILQDPVIIVNGLTKNFRLPGYRICWVIGPKVLLRRLWWLIV